MAIAAALAVTSCQGEDAAVTRADTLAAGLPEQSEQAAQVARDRAAAEAAASKAAADRAAVEAAARKAAADRAAAAAAQATQQAAARQAASQRAAAAAASSQQSLTQGFSSGGGTDPHFGTCREAKANGYGPYRQGEDPEYDWYRDSDSDGVVCE